MKALLILLFWASALYCAAHPPVSGSWCIAAAFFASCYFAVDWISAVQVEIKDKRIERQKTLIRRLLNSRKQP